MIALINGIEGNVLDIYKGSNVSLECVLLDDTGAQIDLTGGAVTLQVFDTEDRRNAIIDDAAGTLTDDAAGHVTFAFVPADLSWGPGTNGAPYFGYAKYVASGGGEQVARIPVKINIK